MVARASVSVAVALISIYEWNRINFYLIEIYVCTFQWRSTLCYSSTYKCVHTGIPPPIRAHTHTHTTDTTNKYSSRSVMSTSSLYSASTFDFYFFFSCSNFFFHIPFKRISAASINNEIIIKKKKISFSTFDFWMETATTASNNYINNTHSLSLKNRIVYNKWRCVRIAHTTTYSVWGMTLEYCTIVFVCEEIQHTNIPYIYIQI